MIRHIILRAPSGAFPGGRSVVAAPTDALTPGHEAAAVSPLLTLGRLAIAMLECLAQGDSILQHFSHRPTADPSWKRDVLGVLVATFAHSRVPSPARTTQCGSRASNTSMTTLPQRLGALAELGHPLSPFC